ncbi:MULTISPECIES: serine palmitoyltransferase [Prevotella]|jgi:8-amino-7-oxononanoate synthase|uniref:8-amino-7-oxononanoate synthase n=1 Tax=Prevotella lacticifex TaxID=2854755 RepID=A0A9R1CWH7_9BACT|nr:MULTISPECIES: aminotransferase class I/II-fold pyridoxal phosphate-dependent enzyme [Prevotella]MDD6853601.1 aminotransferase class I/II-fold pyridoxal phosphate-dependent enzyme [Prevotella sp.]MDY6265919.1 aminotransferase class I/II-fold pyridoxal phosphate-dependent enzyme [Prevotella sp.]GJG36962.1 8-amino-7-oxononanoate synthase [Prevotella lacticifex]GJG40538.1 8-amino-7-oxononanoate synthase [Prevotella lacticifex]GJG44234.1 8-amino-7-oxononanoate synthase [Prevotella lacticifex]
MGQLQERYKNYREPQKFMKAGVYPYFREITSKQSTEVTDIDGHKILMFGSNAYTGLTNDQRVIDAAHRALDKYGSGCAGSRFLNGTLDIHVQLEKELAAFEHKDDALCFSMGFAVNAGVIPAVVGRGDYIICDDRDHASIVDGRRLSFATSLHYKHNDMEDLDRVLKKLPHEAVKLIVVDGVFSMEGDLAKLPEIVELKKKYNCSLMVDEAHGLGVFGKQGRGVCDYFGVTDDVDLIMGTFSKSLASVGGFIAGDKDTINYIRHNCRTYIFSASDTPAATAAAMEALHIIENEPERQQHLWDVTKYALKRFREEGFEIGDTESPIIPLYVRDINKTFLVTKLAYDAGVFINPVIPPACAPQDTLVRFALMATHTEEQVEEGVQRLKKIFVEQGIIKK